MESSNCKPRTQVTTNTVNIVCTSFICTLIRSIVPVYAVLVFFQNKDSDKD